MGMSANDKIAGMRVNLIAQTSATSFVPGTANMPLSLLIKPACGVPGDYVYPIDSAALLRLLKAETSLPQSVLQKFKENLQRFMSARILAVELSERVLTEIGYFVE